MPKTWCKGMGQRRARREGRTRNKCSLPITSSACLHVSRLLLGKTIKQAPLLLQNHNFWRRRCNDNYFFSYFRIPAKKGCPVREIFLSLSPWCLLRPPFCCCSLDKSSQSKCLFVCWNYGLPWTWSWQGVREKLLSLICHPNSSCPSSPSLPVYTPPYTTLQFRSTLSGSQDEGPKRIRTSRNMYIREDARLFHFISHPSDICFFFPS